MATSAVASSSHVPWWKEPTKDQWFAWFAGFFGWLVDAFDYVIFLFIMAPIAQEFGVSVTAVAAVLTLTIWLRLIGAIGSGWLADRIGRKVPLMLSIFWFSVCAPRCGCWRTHGRSRNGGEDHVETRISTQACFGHCRATCGGARPCRRRLCANRDLAARLFFEPDCLEGPEWRRLHRGSGLPQSHHE